MAEINQGERLTDAADIGAKNTEEYLAEALARQREALVPHLPRHLSQTRKTLLHITNSKQQGFATPGSNKLWSSMMRRT